jgi:hypothetical protein
VASAPATPQDTPPVTTQLVRAEPAPAPTAPTAPQAPPDPSPATETAFRGRVLLPDLRGLSRSEVMQVTAANGLRATLEGDGTAVRQDPPPGSVVAGGDTVRIEFSGPAPHREARPVAALADGGRG